MALLMHHFFSAPRIRIGATRTFTDTTPIARKNLHHLRVLNVRAPFAPRANHSNLFEIRISRASPAAAAAARGRHHIGFLPVAPRR